MSEKIAEAYVEISARMDRMEADLKAAQSKFTAATDKMQKSASGLGATMTNLRSIYAGIAAIVGGVMVQSIGKAITSTADYLDQLDEMSIKTGVSVETLTSLELAAKNNGVSMQQLAVSIRMMYRSMNEAAGGSKEAAEAYKRLGVEVKDSAGNLKSGNEAFLEIAGAIAEIKNPAERSAMAMKVFGRAGAEMLPMLEGGREALEKYIESAQKLGLVHTAEQAKHAAAFNDALATMTERLRTLKEKAVMPLLEPLTKLFSMLSGTLLPDEMIRKSTLKEIDEVRPKLEAHIARLEYYKKLFGDESQWDFLMRRTVRLETENVVKLSKELYNLQYRLAELNKKGESTNISVDVVAHKSTKEEIDKASEARKTRLIEEQRNAVNELAVLAKEIAARRNEADALAGRSIMTNDIQRKIISLAAEHQAMVNELAALNAEIAVTSDRGKIAEIQGRIDELVKMQAGKVAEIEALNKELNARNQEISSIGDNGKMAEVQSKIAALTAEQQAKIAELTAVNKELAMRKDMSKFMPAQMTAAKEPVFTMAKDKETGKYSLQLANMADAYGKIAEQASIASLQIRGAGGYTGELVEAFKEVDRAVIDTATNISDKLLMPFESMMGDLQSRWSATISEFLRGGQSFSDFMANTFEDILNSFTGMLGQMAAQWVANEIFSGISVKQQSGKMDVLDIIGTGLSIANGVGRMSGGNNIYISAVDSQSFDDALRRNSSSVNNIVYEAARYGRAN